MIRTILRASFLATVSLAATPAQTTTVQQPLPAAAGWDASLIHRSTGGVWYALVDQAIPAYGAPEAIFADDDGRVTVLSVYSGKWTERSVNPDGQWLAPSRPADVDPRVPGREIYAAGMGGNVHRIVVREPHTNRYQLDSVEIAHVADEEFHCIVAADLIPEQKGDELLVFGLSGNVYRLTPSLRDGDPGGSIFTLTRMATLPGRVRDAVVIPQGRGAPHLVGVSRSGHLLAMRLTSEGLEHEVLAHEPMGLGRIARQAATSTRREALYATRDDGVVLRFELLADGVQREAIFAGPQGPRGVAVGRFDEDPNVESVAVFGYSRSVQMLTRRPGGAWEARTIYTDADQGHWLTVGEVDGRNGTDELIATGFGGQVVLLARPPGYGLPGAAVEPSPQEERNAPREPRPVRIAVRASTEAVRELSPLNYQGGFETKTMVYETLVRRGPDGRFVPGLAGSWSVDDTGKEFTFRLREGATFHDGTPVTADAVAVHFRRFMGLPEHDWLRSSRRIQSVRALDPQTLRIELDEPAALLPELCAINPCAIRGPGALDREGRFRKPVGSGPFAFVEALEEGRILRYRRHGGSALVDLLRLDKDPAEDPLDALVRGEADAALGSWLVPIDPARAHRLGEGGRFRVHTAPGSSVTYLDLRYESGPTADRDFRRRLSNAVDRDALVTRCLSGAAAPTTGWAAPALAAIWPQGQLPGERGGPLALAHPLRIARGAYDRPGLITALIDQLAEAGIPAIEISADDPDWDLRVRVTHGAPYDPFTTAVGRFATPVGTPNAASPRHAACSDDVRTLVDRATRTAHDDVRFRLYAEIQRALDEDMPVIPLFVPDRIAVLRADLPDPLMEPDLYFLDASWLVDR